MVISTATPAQGSENRRPMRWFTCAALRWARSETISSSASRTKLETIDEPP